MWRKLIFTVLGLTTVAGCGMPPKGTEILVDTAPPGASCVLSRGGQPIATAEPTPAIAIVPIDTAPVLAQCRRPGFADAEAVVDDGADGAIEVVAHEANSRRTGPFGPRNRRYSSPSRRSSSVG